MEEKLEKEVEFNAKYLMEKYNLGSITILGSFEDGRGYTQSFSTVKGNVLASERLVEIQYERIQNGYYNITGEEDE